MTKKVLYLLIVFYLLSSFGFSLYAKHIVGGELYYECLGFTNNDPNSGSMRYQIYMRLYRDALGGGSDFDSAPGNAIAASVSIYQGSDGTLIPVQYLEAPTRLEVDPNPGNACVQVPSTLQIEEGLYTFREIDLPISDSSYYIVYQRCCRNQAISNINDPGISGATYFIEITAAAQQTCNSSPVFQDFPPFIICVGEDFNFDHSAVDADGHRLEYAFCSPFLGGGPDNQNPATSSGIAPDPDLPPPYNEVAFIPNVYSAQEPLGAASNFSIDPNTGRLRGVPMVEGQFVVGVCVREFDSQNQLLSEVRRDFQFLVTECQKSIEITIDSDSIIADGTFIINSCSLDGNVITNNSTQSEVVDSFYWEFDIGGSIQRIEAFSPTLSFEEAGSYPGRFIITATTGCKDTGLVNVNIIEAAQADFEFSNDNCALGPVTFENLSTGTDGLDVQWTWDFGDQTGVSSLRSPDYLYPSAGSYSISLIANTNNLCADTLEKTLDYFPIPANLSISSFQGQGCSPQSAQFALNNNFLTSDYSINWSFGDGNSAQGASVSYTYAQAGVFEPTLSISAPGSCQLDTILPGLTLQEAPMADFSFTPEEPSSLESTVSFTDRSQRAFSWFWDFAGIGISSDQNPIFSFPDSAGTYPVSLIVMHPNGCSDTLSREVILSAIDDFYIPNAFSPNNDGVNDEFRGFGPLGGRTDYEMAVFARWGDRVFYTQDPNQGWNGKKNNQGEELSQGVYVYYVTFKDQNGDLKILKGLVNLLK